MKAKLLWIRKAFKVKRKRRLDFSPRLYLGSGIDPENLDRLKKRLSVKPLVTNACLLVLAENESDQIDIISSRQLAEPFYADHLLKVIGLTRTKTEAIDMVIRITEDCLSDRQDCSLKEFLAWQ